MWCVVGGCGLVLVSKGVFFVKQKQENNTKKTETCSFLHLFALFGFVLLFVLSLFTLFVFFCTFVLLFFDGVCSFSLFCFKLCVFGVFFLSIYAKSFCTSCFLQRENRPVAYQP